MTGLLLVTRDRGRLLDEHPALTLANAARMLRDAVRNRSYVALTGLGPTIDEFLRYFKLERGKTQASADTYEYCLARLAVHYPDLNLRDFDRKDATGLLRDFLQDQFADVAGSTWNTRVATLKSFFRWAFEEGRIDHNPAAVMRYRQVAESERHAHAPSRIARIVAAQPERRDRVAVQLLGRLALRRNELRLVQLAHVNHDTRELTVFGKGQTVRTLPIPGDLYEQLLREANERLSTPREYLLYPVKLGRVGTGRDARMDVIWQDRLAPLSLSGVDKWWRRILDRAELEAFPMHELRHSAGTNFWRETRDLRLTQRLMRHKSIRTTADTYLHDDAADLAEALDRLPAWEVE